MMRILYLSHMNVRSPRAHVHNVLKTVEALRDASCDVTLLSTDVPPENIQELFSQHAIEGQIKHVFLRTVPFEKTQQPSRIKRALAIVRSSFSFCAYFVRHRNEFDVVYYRFSTYLPIALFAKWILRKTVVFEAHYQYIYPCWAQAFTDYCISTAHGVVAITEALKKVYALSSERSIVAPCHASERELVSKESVDVLREKLLLQREALLLGYTGSIGATIQGISYEVETLVNILPLLPAIVHAVIVGARSDDSSAETLTLLAQKLDVADRVHIFPWCDRVKCMEYLVACDVLMLPRVGTAPGSSPSKMFDYLAVGRPIVAAHTPAVDEILHNEKNALMVNADSLEEWKNAVMRVMNDVATRDRILHGALESAREWTWKKRGERIRDFIQGLAVYAKR